MPTYYDYVPTLVERITGANLIVIGRVAGLREVRPAEGFDRPRTFGLFDVEIEDLLHGDPPDRLLVRVLSGPDHDPDADGGRTTWIVPMDTGARAFLLLTRDVAVDLPDDVYALYFASLFPVEDDEWVIVADDALDEATREAVDIDDRGRVSLASLRRVVDTVTADRDERRRAFETLLPTDLSEHPYPQVLERPDVEQPSQPPRQAPSDTTVDGGQLAEEQPAEASVEDPP